MPNAIPVACVVSPTKATIPIKDADKVVAALRPRFEKVYEQNLFVDPNMEGKLDWEAVVTPNGEVAMVKGQSNASSFAQPSGVSTLTGTITCKRKQ